MTELSWLIDLLLHHKLDDKTKKHVTKRISFVETKVNTQPYMPFTPPQAQPKPVVHGAVQSASTAALLAKHGMTEPMVSAPEPVATPGIAAATPATAIAMQSRQQAIEMALSGKNEKGRTSPRKF